MECISVPPFRGIRSPPSGQISSGRHSQGDTISFPLENDGILIISYKKKEESECANN